MIHSLAWETLNSTAMQHGALSSIGTENLWTYRGEGNCSLVVSHNKKHVVYRLTKKNDDKDKKKEALHKRTKLDYESTKCKFTDNMLYVKNIMMDLLGHQLVHAGNIITLPEEFSRQIVDSFPSDVRPLHRQHKTIDINCPFAVVLPDFCFLPSKSTQLKKPTYSIEIKPKSGYLPSTNIASLHSDIKSTVCVFCMHQLLKYSNQQWEYLSRYCPIDLYSGDPERMLYALKALLETPQNNLRIFKDGKLAWGDGLSGDADFLCDLDVGFPRSHIIKQSDDKKPCKVGHPSPITTNGKKHDNACDEQKHHQCKNVKNDMKNKDKNLSKAIGFMEVVLSCLLSEIGQPSLLPLRVVKQPQNCKAKKQVNSSGGNSLPVSSVLGRILQAQLLDDLDIPSIMPLYERVEQHLLKHPDEREKFTSHRKYSTNVSAMGIEKKDDGSVHYAVKKVQEYLISRTVKDCSLMIAIQEYSDDVDGPPPDDCHIVKMPGGLSYVFRASIIDLDPKAWAKIPTYLKQDNDIVTNYVNNHTQQQ